MTAFAILVVLLKAMEHINCCGEGYENVAPFEVGTVSSFIDWDGSSCLIKTDGIAQCWEKDGAGQSSEPADFQ